MLGGVVGTLIDAQAQRHVGAVGGRANHDLARAGTQMQRGLGAFGEQASRFDYHLHAELLPRQFRGIAFGQNLEAPARQS